MQNWADFKFCRGLATIYSYSKQQTKPTNQPTQPTNQPTNQQPASQPASQPTNQASKQASNQPTTNRPNLASKLGWTKATHDPANQPKTPSGSPGAPKGYTSAGRPRAQCPPCRHGLEERLARSRLRGFEALSNESRAESLIQTQRAIRWVPMSDVLTPSRQTKRKGLTVGNVLTPTKRQLDLKSKWLKT